MVFLDTFLMDFIFSIKGGSAVFAYLNETERTAKNKIIFSVEAVLEVGEDESFDAPVPVIWDERILGGIDIDRYDIYYICTHARRTGQYNRVTDFKRIWKLANLPDGIWDGTYDTDEGRVYWGMYRARGEAEFRRHLSPTMLLSLRMEKPTEPDSLYALWKKYRIGFDDDLPEELVNELNPAANRRYILHYANVISNPTLEIWGANADTIFSRNEREIYHG